MLKPIMAMVSRLSMRSLSTQLVVWNTVMLALLLGALGAGLKLAVKHTIMASVEQQLLQQTQHGPPLPGRGPHGNEPAHGEGAPGPPPDFMDFRPQIDGKNGTRGGHGGWSMHRAA